MTDNVKEAVILDEQQSLKDGMENLIAQLGTEADKRSHTTFVNHKMLSQAGNHQELSAMYRTDWVSGKLVDIIPDDMCREWRQFIGDIDPDVIDELVAEEERLGLSGAFNQSHKWARLYGTAYIIMAIDDGLTPDMPLDLSKLKKGCLRHIKAVDRHRIDNSEVTPIHDPMHESFGLPEYYRIAETSIRIHHSRVLRFDGVMLPFDEFRRNNYNSDSILCRLYDALINFNTTANSAASMVFETNVDIMKVKGLMAYLSSPEGEALLRKRFLLASTMKSFNSMMLLDQDEEYTNKTNSFAGIPDLLNAFALFLAGAGDVPATRLLGSAASGLNATGEGDLKNYYDTVASSQKKDYKPKLDYFDKIMAIHLGLPEEVDLKYEFNSLFQMTPAEIAAVNLVDAQRHGIYLDQGVITEEIVAKELIQSKTYSNIDDAHMKNLEEIDYDPTNNELIPKENEEEEVKETETSEKPEKS